MNETKDEIINILHNCYEKIKQLEIVATSSTTFILAIYEDEYNYIDLKKALSRFSGVEKELYGCLYDRNGYNEYFIELNSLEDLNLLASMLGRNVEVSIDYNNVIPRIRLNKEDEDK